MSWPFQHLLPQTTFTHRHRCLLWALAASLGLHALIVSRGLQHASRAGAYGGSTQGAGLDRRPPTPVWALRMEPPIELPTEPSTEPPVAPVALPEVPRADASATPPMSMPSRKDEPALPRLAAVQDGMAPLELPAPASTTAPTTSPTTPGPNAAAGAAAATEVPASFQQRLRVRRGAHVGWADWTWQLDAGRYQTRLTGQLQGPGSPPALDWHSQGGLDGDGVAPERYVARAARGGARAVNFERDTGRISFSGPTGQQPLPPAAQDRLSWLVQLMALVRARDRPPSQPAPDDRFDLWVAGPQGDAGDWTFRIERAGPDGSLELARAASRRFDLQVQVHLGPPPQRRLLRLTMAHEGGSQAPWEFTDAPPGYPAHAVAASNPLPTIRP